MTYHCPPFDLPGKFYRGNLHTHSTLSDGLLSPSEVCARYSAEGYDFICLSDHLVGRYGYPIADTRPFRQHGFTTLIGAEVHTGSLGNGEIWHLLAVGLPDDFAAPVAPDFQAENAPESGATLAQRCRDAGAFVAVAHPQWYNLSIEDARTITAAHAVEIYNHSCAVESDRGDGTAILDLLSSDGTRLSAIATDDAHFSCADHFGGWVYVKAEANEPDALLAALKSGHHYSSQGPLLHDIRIDGDEVVISCSPVESIIAVGARASSERVFGSGISSATLPTQRFQDASWLRVVVIDRFGRRAWSNPIWLD